MADTPTWQILLGLVAAGLLIYFFRPSIRTMLAQSRDAPKDWAGALIPLGLVVLFVIFLIMTV